jgi:hypothetical protein
MIFYLNLLTFQMFFFIDALGLIYDFSTNSKPLDGPSTLCRAILWYVCLNFYDVVSISRRVYNFIVGSLSFYLEAAREAKRTFIGWCMVVVLLLPMTHSADGATM